MANGGTFRNYGIHTVCRQMYSYRRLVAVGKDGNEEIDVFRFPSCCQCRHVIGGYGG